METSNEPLPLTPLLLCSHVTLLLTSTSGRESSTWARPGLFHSSSTHSSSLCPCLCTCMHMGMRDQGCGVGCSCPPGEGSGDCCCTHWGWHGAGLPGAPGTQTAGTPGCRLALDPSEALEELTRLKDWGRAMFPWTLLASLAPDPHPMAPDPHSLESPPSPQVQG